MPTTPLIESGAVASTGIAVTAGLAEIATGSIAMGLSIGSLAAAVAFLLARLIG